MTRRGLFFCDNRWGPESAIIHRIIHCYATMKARKYDQNYISQ